MDNKNLHTNSWSKDADYRLKNRKWLRYSSNIARRILAVIEDKEDFSQANLARLLGVSPQHISKIVKGKENLTLETIANISTVLETELISFPEYKYSTSYNQATQTATGKPLTPIHDDERKDEVNRWFDEFTSILRADQLIFGDEKSLVHKTREASSIYFIKKIIKDYLFELKEHYKRLPLKLALGLSDSKILVWSEIKDDDEATEDALLLAEAKVNGEYYPYGFYLTSTIIEKSDNLDIPPHYHKILG